MKYKKCLICDQETKNIWVELWFHLKPISFCHLRFVKGTYETFGLRAALGNISPLFGTLINWKYRKSRLVIPD